MLNSCRISALLVFTIILCSPASADEGDKWQGHIEFLGKPGTVRSLGQTDIFAPLFQDDDSLLFMSLRGQKDNSDNIEGNFGLGYRRLYTDWIIGGWGYFDVRRTENDNTFLQGNIGMEALSNIWDFRINVYIPEYDRKRVQNLDTVVMDGNSIGVRLGEERALPGFDIEAGYKLPFFEDTRIYAGGYHFDADGFNNVTGPRARLEMRFHDLPLLNQGSRLALGVEVTHDDVRDTQGFGLIQLRIPFGTITGKKTRVLTPLERRMVDPVVRDVDIISSVALTDPVPAFTNIGGPVSIVDANDDIATEVIDAGPNSLVIVDASEGTVNTTGIVMQPGQTLTGADGQALPITLQYYDKDGDIYSKNYTIPAGTPGAEIHGTGTSGENVITLADSGTGNTISDLTISGEVGGGAGIHGDEARLTLRDSIITDVGGKGIDIFDNSIVEINNSTIQNTGDDGIRADGGNNISITGNTQFINLGGAGVRLGSGDADDINTVTITNTSISNANSQGIVIDGPSTVNMTNLTIDTTGNDAISADGSTVNINGGTFTNIGSVGVDLGNATGLVGTSTIDGLTINGTTFDSVRIDNSSTVDISNSNFSNAGDSGLDIRNGSDVDITITTIDTTSTDGISADGSTVDINSIAISNTGAEAIQFINGNTVSLDTITIDTTTGDGIEMQNNNTVTLMTGVTITNAGTRGLDFFDNNVATSITSLSIDVTGDDGIRINDGNTISINGLTLTNVTNEGIDLDGSTGGNVVTISNGLVDTIGTQGINIVNSTSGNTVTINNNTIISNTMDDGISADNATINMTDSTIQDVLNSKIGADLVNSSLTMTNSTIKDIANRGIRGTSGSVISLDNSIIQNTGSIGVDLSTGSTFTMTNNSNLDTTASDAINADNATVTITDSTVQNAGSVGIDLDNGSSLVMTNSTLDITANRGIRAQNASIVTLQSNSTVSNTGSRGIDLLSGSSLILTNSTIDTTALEGMHVNSSNATVTGSIIKNTGTEGIELHTSANTLVLNNTTFENLTLEALDIDGTLNNISGSGNIVVLPMPGGACVLPGSATGSISFTDFDGLGNPGTCP